MKKETLKDAYFQGVPNARRINPVFQSIFEFFYLAHKQVKQDSRVLNIYASEDLSSHREEVYRTHFFKDAEYHGIDWWHEKFIPEGKTKEEIKEKHTLPYADNYFDLVITTKIIMEHISEPELVLRDMYRVLKPGGEVFVIAPLVRRQHQAPYDFFRYTEFGLRYLFEKAGFKIIDISPSNGFMATAAAYAYFFQRGLGLPKPIEKIFDFLHKWIIEPIFYTLDRLDNGYGRDMTQYFLVRARK